MALAFMLNPSRGRKRKPSRGRRKTKWARCMRAAAGDARVASRLMKGKKGCRISAKARAALRSGRKLRKAGARRKSAIRSGIFGARDMGLSMFMNNPRRSKKRRNRKGGRKMATKRRRKSTKRSRAAKKGWRTWKRRHGNRKPRVGKRGRRNNPRGSKRRRRNVWRDDSRGHRKAARKGWRRRRSRRRRNPLAVRGMYSNPRRRKHRRSGRRRNPGFALGGTFGSIKRTLTSTRTLSQFAAGAAGGTLSGFGGAFLAGQVRKFFPGTFEGTLGTVLDTASAIAAAVLLASFVPARFRMAFMLGGGAAAAKPLVDMALAPALQQLAPAAGLVGMGGPSGFAGWISVAQAPRIGQLSGMGGRGVGAWITAQQMARGFRGLGDYSWGYGSPIPGVLDYSRQPAAMMTDPYGLAPMSASAQI